MQGREDTQKGAYSLCVWEAMVDACLDTLDHKSREEVSYGCQWYGYYIQPDNITRRWIIIVVKFTIT